MKCLESKEKIADDLVSIINSYIVVNSIDKYIEPFVGGANIITYIQCNERIALDTNKYIIKLFNYLINDGELPGEVTIEQYIDAKAHYNKKGRHKNKYEDWYLGFLGFICSKGNTFFGDWNPDYKEDENNLIEQVALLKDTIFRVEQTTRDMYESFDECIENLKKQIRKYKTKLEKRFKGKKIEEIDWEPYDFQDEYSEEDFNIIKTKTISVKPMFVEEAILQMNLLNHQFYVFKNAESGLTDIVYKRKDGDYGLIETK